MATTEAHVEIDLIEDDIEIVEEKPKVCLRAGQSIVAVKPVFSHDGKCLFCVSGTTVKVFSTTGGGCIRELKGHTQTITDVCLNPRNRLQILTCSVDGWIKQWDYTDGVILRKFNVNTPLYGILCYKETSKLTVAVIQEKKPKSKGYELVRYVLSDWLNDSKPKPSTLLDHCSANRKSLHIGAQDKYLASIREKSLVVVDLKNGDKRTVSKDENCYTCITCHPVQPCIVIGDELGRIHFWWNFFKKNPVETSYHWHSLPVKCLEFTQEGSNLLSGGHECVLVKWQFDSSNRDFLPRLGSPINHITCSPDNTVYALSQDDNAIRLISNTYSPVCFYQGLTRGHMSQVKPRSSTGLLFDPLSKALVTNGRVGHLQFYNVHTDIQLFNLDITCQNYISPDSLSKDSMATQVTKATFNHCGKWLATAEYWSAENLSPEIRIKFWIFNEEKQTYILNTSVEFPHEEEIHWLKFRPWCRGNKDLLMVVSTCQDGSFKLWSAEDSTDLYGTVTKWMCESSSTYRDLPAGQAEFTEDGSILGVVFKSTVTLWNPDTNELKATLHSNLGDFNINNISFGCNKCCQYLVTTSDEHITSWNLLSLSVQWTVNVRVSTLIADPFSTVMAAFTTDRHLFVFEPSKPQPVYKHSTVSLSAITGAVFIPHNKSEQHNKTSALSWQTQCQLYFMNMDQKLSTVDYEDHEDDRYSTLSVKSNIPKTPFGELIAEKSTRDKQPETNIDLLRRKDSSFVNEILITSPHVQPPVTVLCSKFLQSLLISEKKSSQEKEEEEEEDYKETHDSDSDSEMDIKDNNISNQMEIDILNIEHLDIDISKNKKKERAKIEAVCAEEFTWFKVKK
ncbi:hypothetical protein LOTGIDRAFT_236208 [Lottia gigantea]|uniref:WD repeat-containing protein 75 second beta-propeller domain-containing protein n=1 Tax=Lottia gigantea TaxID=225164 RepID=V3Z1V7_LOTGI|nr:hypothetical protein LOTGIDRAFT_236208 [Lottia gigantea]ESO84533.1 hypothetical protein LOTGIDRAFT_236208 [Lottia gigantea]